MDREAGLEEHAAEPPTMVLSGLREPAGRASDRVVERAAGHRSGPLPKADAAATRPGAGSRGGYPAAHDLRCGHARVGKVAVDGGTPGGIPRRPDAAQGPAVEPRRRALPDRPHARRELDRGAG